MDHGADQYEGMIQLRQKCQSNWRQKIPGLGIALLLLISSIQALCAAPSGSAELESLFGPEYTFTAPRLWKKNNGPILKFRESQKALKEFIEFLRGELEKKEIPHTLVESEDGHGRTYVLTLKNGVKIEYTVDTYVIEVKMKKMPQVAIEKNRGAIEDLIFKPMERFGLTPRPPLGGGHISIDFRIFEKNPLLFRNFLVDMANHPELGSGIWGSDLLNAPLIQDLTWSQRLAFKRAIEDFDSGRIQSAEQLANLINSKVYTRPVQWHLLLDANKHMQAVGLKTILEDAPKSGRRVELRHFNPQRSVQEYIDQTALLRARINYLNRQGKPIPYLARGGVRNAQESVNLYHSYVTEAGKDWTTYNAYLPDELRPLSPTPVTPSTRDPDCYRRVIQNLKMRLMPRI
jgi:hypothetical protein